MEIISVIIDQAIETCIGGFGLDYDKLHFTDTSAHGSS